MLDLQHNERAETYNTKSRQNFPNRVLHGNPFPAPDRSETPLPPAKAQISASVNAK
jgi:hypothetical protein